MNETRKAGRPPGQYKGLVPVSVGSRRTVLFNKWSSMKARCRNVNHPAFKYYGGRGVDVCPRWLGPPGLPNVGFQAFCADMGEPPAGYTLERIDGSKGYEPSNCRWATWKEQAANRSRNGPAINPDSLRQKAIKAGLPYMRVYQRIHYNQWPETKALSTPVRAKRT